MSPESKEKQLKLSDEDKKWIANVTFGEAAGANEDVQKMVIRTVLNRLRSSRDKEFGATVPEIVNKGYYAAINQNDPYSQALSGEFPDINSKATYGNINTLIDAIVGDQDFGEAMFYFTDDEIGKLHEANKKRVSQGRAKKFNFDAVKPLKIVDKYKTYGY